MLRVPPVVLITVHDEGMQWSGRREESRGDPRCLARGLGGGVWGGCDYMFTCIEHKSWTTLSLSVITLPFPPLLPSHTKLCI